ncbi:acylneuraminate cytidylyltransferase family protein [Gammaproteobacteria bacterium]|jgi:CMP-N,N'-diacetyllegionaminic acid synthase|nr:acylneuraminate cytidylyltransferase family protein [Gammaproteobacteria bacterium]
MTRSSKDKQLNVMGIIGVRSGSKGVENKNIRPLAGKPLVGWVIEKALKSKNINRLVISTDSVEYKDIAESFGAEVPYLRPKELSQDSSPEFDYVLHMLNHLKEKEGYQPDIVVRLMATVPLQTIEDIDTCIKNLINDTETDSCVVIAEARQHPLKALKIMNSEVGKKKLVTYFSESGREVTPIGRQNYDKAYYRSNIIACRTSVIYDTDSLTGDNVSYHIIDQKRSIDIDNIIDFEIAELLMK